MIEMIVRDVCNVPATLETSEVLVVAVVVHLLMGMLFFSGCMALISAGRRPGYHYRITWWVTPVYVVCWPFALFYITLAVLFSILIGDGK